MSAEDQRREQYLWDPSAPPDPEVRLLEECLAPARFDPRRQPLAVPLRSSRGPVRFRAPVALAAAAVIAIALGVSAYWSWRWSWKGGAPWLAEIHNAADNSRIHTTLAVNTPLQLGGMRSARIDIARIGTMNVSPGSALTLAETASARHRVLLDRGSVSVRIWAPPGMFAFRTPAGTIRDLGCIFDLSVDGDGTSRVRVDTGWVQMTNDFGESLVPAGASAVMRKLGRPGAPIFLDASEAFEAAVRAAENGDEAAERRELGTVLRTARRRDVLTLLMLANVSGADVKRALLTRATELWPAPSGVSVEAIVAGDRDQLWKWHDSLDLPPAKNWWRNWRDALPLRR